MPVGFRIDIEAIDRPTYDEMTLRVVPMANEDNQLPPLFNEERVRYEGQFIRNSRYVVWLRPTHWHHWNDFLGMCHDEYRRYHSAFIEMKAAVEVAMYIHECNLRTFCMFPNCLWNFWKIPIARARLAESRKLYYHFQENFRSRPGLYIKDFCGDDSRKENTQSK